MYSSLRRSIKPFSVLPAVSSFSFSQVSLIKAHLGERLGPSSLVSLMLPDIFISYFGVIGPLFGSLFGSYLGVTWHIHINLMTYLGHKLFFRWGERWQACQHWRPALSIHRCFDLSCIVHNCKYVSILYHTLYNISTRHLRCMTPCHECRKPIWTRCSTLIPTMEQGRQELGKNTIIVQGPTRTSITCWSQFSGMPETTSSATGEWRWNPQIKRDHLFITSIFSEINFFHANIYFQGRGGREGRRSRNVRRGGRTSRSRKGQKLVCTQLKYGDGRYLSS